MIVHGKTSDNKIIPLLLDANGNVIVSIPDYTSSGNPLSVDGNDDLYITGREPSLFKPTTLADGTQYVLTYGAAQNNDMITVPTGERWKVGLIVSYYAGTVSGVRLLPYVSIATVRYTIATFENIATGVFYPVNPFMILTEDDVIGLRVTGGTTGNTIQQYVFGEKI